MDFTLKKYKELLFVLKSKGYEFQTFSDFLESQKEKVIMLRHDVDLLPQNSLEFAKIQHEFDIKGSYYFRAVPESWDDKIIKSISLMGHEIGYHYENLTTCNGNIDDAIADFDKHLKLLREIAPVSTICMHGSPMSKYDSKDIWSKYNYRNFGINGEPYFDIDFNEVFYLTDTGRRWDGFKVSVRDKVDSKFTLSFNKTSDIIQAVHNDKLPSKVMFTFHPQRWNSNIFLWSKELIFQNMKNVVKRYLYVKN